MHGSKQGTALVRVWKTDAIILSEILCISDANYYSSRIRTELYHFSILGYIYRAQLVWLVSGKTTTRYCHDLIRGWEICTTLHIYISFYYYWSPILRQMIWAVSKTLNYMYMIWPAALTSSARICISINLDIFVDYPDIEPCTYSSYAWLSSVVPLQ